MNLIGNLKTKFIGGLTMEKSFITILKLIEKDLEYNHSSYDASKFKLFLEQFQIKILDIRKKDPDLQVSLQNFSIAGLKKLIKELDLHILKIPGQKYKLVSVINSLIIQESKKSQFLKLAQSQKVSQVSTRSTTKKGPIFSPGDNEKIRNSWLTHDDLNKLSKEMIKMKISDLRAIVKPWNIKGRSKQEIADKTIKYINRMRNLSKFGS